MNPFQTIIHILLYRIGNLLGVLFRHNYIKKAQNGRIVSEKRLMKIIRSSRNTEYGKKYDFKHIKTISDYQKMVPLSTYDDYKNYIERTAKEGEQGLICKQKIKFLATTSGTTGGIKFIPQVTAAYFPCFKIICIYLNDIVRSVRLRGKSRKTMRGLLVTDVNSDTASKNIKGNNKIRTGLISAYSARGMKFFLPLFTALPKIVFDTSEISDMKYIKLRYALQEPGLKWFGGIYMSSLVDLVNYMLKHSDLLIHDIETGTINPTIKMSDHIRTKLERKLRPDRKRAAELREIFSTPSDIPLLSRIWKEMSAVIAIGMADFEPFTKKMRTFFSSDVKFGFEAYAASECVIGSAMHMEDPSYLLLLDSGFFEFLPIESECKEMPKKPLLLNELETGKHYEIIITNRAGLYRYAIHDVVKVSRFEGETPYIEFSYRTTNITDICGAHITCEHVASAVKSIEKAYNINIIDYSLYANKEHDPPRIELFFEANPFSSIITEKKEQMENMFDEALQKTAWDYVFYRNSDSMGNSLLHPVASGTYAHYREILIADGASENQLKAMRVIDSQEKLDYFNKASLSIK